jgi:ribosome assembly protein YihI (activator of Der GTPase)
LPSCTEECGGWLRPGVAAVATVSKWEQVATVLKWEQEVRDDPQMGRVAGHKAGSRWANAGKIKERNCAARDKEVE